MKIVIIAGGKGTRLKDIAKDIPKPMVPVNGKPILEYQIELAKRYGYKEVLILTGHLGDQIQQYFGNGKKWGVKIEYFQEPKPLGTAGCVKVVEDKFKEDFFVFYGDTIMDVDLKKMALFHQKNKGLATLFLHPNDHPYDSDLVDIDDKNKVTTIYPKALKRDRYLRNLVNAALYVLNPKVFSYIKHDESSDFGKDIFPRILKAQEKIFGYVSPEYIKDMGTPDRLNKVAGDISSGKVSRRNLKNKRPAIFLDRDGVINRDIDLIHRTEDMNLLPWAAEAIKKINNSDFLAVVVTNQPIIARNLTDFAGLRQIHNKMETLLGEQHAYIDALYFCPHHPDKGFPEERKEFKIKCKCRKPQPGMLLQAAKDLHIDLKHSYLIGDRDVDMAAGKNAGVKTILVKRNGEIDYNPDIPADQRSANILTAVDLILKEESGKK